MLWPTKPSSVVASVSTSGDSATVPLEVRCGGCNGTRTVRTRSDFTLDANACAIVPILMVCRAYAFSAMLETPMNSQRLQSQRYLLFLLAQFLLQRLAGFIGRAFTDGSDEPCALVEHLDLRRVKAGILENLEWHAQCLRRRIPAG